jgi:hypothetical protein
LEISTIVKLRKIIKENLPPGAVIPEDIGYMLTFADKFKVDIIISPRTAHMVKGLDFECNGLVILPTTGNIALCEELANDLTPVEKIFLLQKITNNILNKIAVVIKPKIHRIKKMVDKGWLISFPNGGDVEMPELVTESDDIVSDRESFCGDSVMELA